MDQALISAVVCLGGVIAVLNPTNSTNHTRTQSQLDDCLEDREILHHKVGGLTVRIDELESEEGSKNG